MRWLGAGRSWLGNLGKEPERGQISGVTIVEGTQLTDQTKAPADGVYTLDGKRFRARQGMPMPPGAVFDGEPAEQPQRGSPARPGGPPNRSTLTRAQLNEQAKALGIEDPESYPNKDALLVAIAGASESGPAENTNGGGPEQTT
jgi:hypothetical protein